jgi:hypothetical protein
MEAGDIGWLRNYDLAHTLAFYRISVYITCAFEVGHGTSAVISRTLLSADDSGSSPLIFNEANKLCPQGSNPTQD